VCDICKGELPYNEHKKQVTLFIEVKDNRDLKANKDLIDYLTFIAPFLEENGVQGVAFPQM